jgi:hypothetical protein
MVTVFTILCSHPNRLGAALVIRDCNRLLSKLKYNLCLDILLLARYTMITRHTNTGAHTSARTHKRSREHAHDDTY